VRGFTHEILSLVPGWRVAALRLFRPAAGAAVDVVGTDAGRVVAFALLFLRLISVKLFAAPWAGAACWGRSIGYLAAGLAS
jgi:hypothetical protein